MRQRVRGLGRRRQRALAEGAAQSEEERLVATRERKGAARAVRAPASVPGRVRGGDGVGLLPAAALWVRAARRAAAALPAAAVARAARHHAGQPAAAWAQHTRTTPAHT